VHNPSEHTINNEHYDLEMHFVHTYMNGTLGAVIGVLFDTEAGGDWDNYFIEQWLEIEKAQVGRNIALNTMESPLFIRNFLEDLDESFGGYYSYEGSLTTPPCTEGIKWTVMDKIQPISKRQIKYFENQWSKNSTFALPNWGNNRKVQPLNGRDIFHQYDLSIEGKELILTVIALAVLFGLTMLILTITCICCCVQKSR